LQRSLLVFKHYANALPFGCFFYIALPSAEINLGYFYFGTCYAAGIIFALMLTMQGIGIWTAIGLGMSLLTTYCSDSIHTLKMLR